MKLKHSYEDFASWLHNREFPIELLEWQAGFAKAWFHRDAERILEITRGLPATVPDAGLKLLTTLIEEYQEIVVVAGDEPQ